MPGRVSTLKKLSSAAAASTLLLASLPASATGGLAVPEPDTLGLIAAGAITGLVIWVRNRRRK